MNFNKCARCGCFFSSDDLVCPNCKSKDETDKNILKSYIENNDIPENAESLAFHCGINIKNINRFLNTKEFSDLKNSFDNSKINAEF